MVALLQRLRPVGSFVSTVREMVNAWVFDCKQPIFQQCTADHVMPIDANEELWHHPHTKLVSGQFILGTKTDAHGCRAISMMRTCNHCGQILSTLEWRSQC